MAKQHKHHANSAKPAAPASTAPEVTLNLVTVVKQLGFLLLVVMVTGYVGWNIAVSQQIHPLYAQLVRESDEAWVLFFKIAGDLPQYEDDIAPFVSGTYERLSDNVTADDVTRQEKIAVLKGYLEDHPDAPQLLYAIGVLYAQGGDLEQSEEYLQQAKTLDPNLEYR